MQVYFTLNSLTALSHDTTLDGNIFIQTENKNTNCELELNV